MSLQPNSRALFGGGPWPRGGQVDLFNTAEACLAFMFGPPQHDAHVRARRVHLHLTAQHERVIAADAAVRQLLADMIERDRTRRAAEAPAVRAHCAQAHQEFFERRALRLKEREQIP